MNIGEYHVGQTLEEVIDLALTLCRERNEARALAEEWREWALDNVTSSCENWDEVPKRPPWEVGK